MAAALASAAQNAAIARLQRKVNAATGPEKNALQKDLNNAKRNATARRVKAGGPEPNRVVGTLDASALAALGGAAPVAAAGAGAGAGAANLSKYMKMLKMGIPLPAVKQKMMTNGIEPVVRNAFNGTAPAPAPAPAAPQVAAPAPQAVAPAAQGGNQGNALQQLYASLNNTSINALVTTISAKVKALIETAQKLTLKVRGLAANPNVNASTLGEIRKRVEAFKDRIRDSLGRLNTTEATQLGAAMGELEQALNLLQGGSSAPMPAAQAANAAVLAVGGTSASAASAASAAASAAAASAAAASSPAGPAQLRLSPANLAGGLAKLRARAAPAAAAQAAQQAVLAAGGNATVAAQAAVTAANSSAAAGAAQDAVLAAGGSPIAAANAAAHAAALASGSSAGNSSAAAVLAAGGNVASANAAQAAEAAAAAAGVPPALAAQAGAQAAALAAPANARSALLANIEAQRAVLKPVGESPAPLPTAQQQLLANLAAGRAALRPPTPLAPLATAPVLGQPLLNPPTPGAYVAPASAANRLEALRAPQLQAAAAAAAENNAWDPNANLPSAGAQTAANASARLSALKAAQEQQLAPAPAPAPAPAEAEPSPSGLFGNNTNNYEPTPETANKVQKIKNYMNKEVTGKENRKDKMENSIKFVREFLEKDDTPRSKALLDYVKEKYDGQTMAALEGEMDKKHIPVLRYILTLATSPDLDFIKSLDKPIPGDLYEKTDLNVRSNLITKVAPTFSGVIPKMLATIKGRLTEKRAAQSGGSRKTRCGCGTFGGRRTRRVSQRKTRKSRR